VKSQDSGDTGARINTAIVRAAGVGDIVPPFRSEYPRRSMPTLPELGELVRDADVPDWWVSQPVPVPFFSGRPLRFVIESDDDSGTIEPDFVAAVAAFRALGDAQRVAISGAVHSNYREMLDAVEDLEPLDIASAADIWRFVVPTEVRVSRRDRRDRDVYVSVDCECDWEEEHGLQLVFRRGNQLVRVSEQDGHLTHADAFDLPDEEDPGLR
jgi:hypothetical protein